jgi:hypothetical protein
MARNKAFIVIAVTTALGMLGTFPAAAATERDRGSERDRDNVLPCSLVGVNPAYHPEIFGNAAAAASYGFVRSPNGTWQVRPGCRR